MGSVDVQATGEFVIVEPDLSNTIDMVGKIVIPDSAKEDLKLEVEECTIISAGVEADPNIKPGKQALVFMGTCVPLPPVRGKNYLICRTRHIAAVL